MPRVLFESTWFEAISSRSWYERDYERIIIERSSQIFKDWICVPFSADVVGEDGSIKRPDLALIDVRYRTWWVVEVELSHHNFANHVLPQVDAFRTATYDSSHATALAMKDDGLEESRLVDMMRGVSPEVLVIVDTPNVSWRAPLEARGVRLAIVEPFRDAANHLLLRLNGDQPEPPAAVLTRCSRYKGLRRLWRVHSPAALPSEDPEQPLNIYYEGVSSVWQRVVLQDAVMLHAQKGDILAGLTVVELVVRDDGALLFLPVSKTRRGK